MYLTSEKLKETINWGIEATMLESGSLKMFLDFDKIEKPIWVLNSYNPLFLGFIYKKALLLFKLQRIYLGMFLSTKKELIKSVKLVF